MNLLSETLLSGLRDRVVICEREHTFGFHRINWSRSRSRHITTVSRYMSQVWSGATTDRHPNGIPALRSRMRSRSGGRT